jgi:hypothetical protein
VVDVFPPPPPPTADVDFVPVVVAAHCLPSLQGLTHSSDNLCVLEPVKPVSSATPWSETMEAGTNKR